MPAKTPASLQLPSRPLARARRAIKVSRPLSENLCRQARLFREQAGVVQVVSGACNIIFNRLLKLTETAPIS